MIEGGDGRTPGWGLVCPDSPQVWQLQISGVEGGRAAEASYRLCEEGEEEETARQRIG